MKNFSGSALFLISFSTCLTSTLVASISIPRSQNIKFANTNSLTGSDLDGSVSNLTSLGAIDPAFGFVPFFGGDKLAPLSCLLTSVNVALELALGDSEGLIPRTVYRLDSHPQVEISVFPEDEGGVIPRKYAVWGINIGIDLMIRNVNFQSAIFFISYRGRGIGAIHYKLAGASDSISADTLNATLSAAQNNENMSLFNQAVALVKNASDGSNTNMNTTSVTNDPQLRVAFTLTGSTLTIYNIFYAALDMLRELADYKRTVRLTEDTTFIRSSGLDISTIDPNNPPRTVRNPPYFQAEWLMRALAQTPAYMLEQRSFREVDMDLFVDEIKIGVISLKKRPAPSGLLQSAFNASTS